MELEASLGYMQPCLEGEEERKKGRKGERGERKGKGKKKKKKKKEKSIILLIPKNLKDETHFFN